MNVIRSLVLLSACAFLACASTDREVVVQSGAVQPAARAAKTYAIGSDEQAPPLYRSSPSSREATRHVRPMLEELLRAKGYVPAASVADADLVWVYVAGRRERVKPVAQPRRDPTGDSYLVNDPDEEFEEGAVVIDALDKNGVRVWHGFGRTEIDPYNVDDALLRKTVTQIMARFPSSQAIP